MSTPHQRRVRHVTVRVACVQLVARPLSKARQALEDITRAIARAATAGGNLVVLPECSYPGYVLLDSQPYRSSIPSDRTALETIAAQAARRKIDVCVGVARRGADGRLRNAAVYIDHRGVVLGSYAKCRLWNFDHSWFARGDALPVIQTRFGRIGMMICADGRNPEIARTLAAQGAWLILDPTAWVGSAATYATLRNPQADYMLRVRALENGVWIAAADKCGSELSAVHYAGRSQIVDPHGNVAAMADAARPELIMAMARMQKPAPFVAAISKSEQHILRKAHRTPKVIARMPPRMWIGVYQSSRGRMADPQALAALRAQGAAVIIDTGASATNIQHTVSRARGVRVSLFQGQSLMAPEPARARALAGDDLFVWLRPPAHQLLLEVARTRALENRIYVVLATSTQDSNAACLIAPDGSVAGSALRGVPSGFVGLVDTIVARRKEVVPSTQTFGDRMPRIYRWLNHRATAKERVR